MAETGKKRQYGTIVRGILAVCLLAYLFFAFLLTDMMYASQKVNGMDIKLNTSNKQNFVTVDNIRQELSAIHIDSSLIAKVNLGTIEHSLRDVVNIEEVKVNKTVNGKIKVEVVPVIPVARVFDNMGNSYYINKTGKKLQADTRYHTDVPVITGNVDDGVVKASDLLPLMNYINSDQGLSALTTALKIDKNHDVILIPNIKGHVVNLGAVDDKDIADKFERLFTIYRDVIPYKGWQFYDTISVKYAGQVVATRTKKTKPVSDLLYELVDAEEVSLDNMTTDEN